MHKVVASNLKHFSEEFGMTHLPQEYQFERFVNYCVFSKYYPEAFDVDDLTTGTDDESIDGACAIIGEQLVSTREEAEAIFSSIKARKSIEVTFVFCQAKRTDGFELGEMLKFFSGIGRVFDDTHDLSDELLSEIREIHTLTLDNLGKVQNGRPNLHAYYASTGVWNEDKNLVKGCKGAKKSLDATGFFNEAEVLPLDREKLIRSWLQTRSHVQAQFTAEQIVPFPAIDGVRASYLLLTGAKEFVEKVLSDEDGRMRMGVFEQNVRAFLGDENPVNQKIKTTLADNKNRDKFSILNNGLTIVSPDVKIQGQRVSVSDYQIVNGCQTSHVLFRNQGSLEDNKVMLPIKIIDADDPEIVGKIVEATNSQSKVDESQFFSIRPFVQKVEQYFNAIDDKDDSKIFFERRTRQYEGSGISKIRIFDIERLARAYAAMFLNLPHLACRYPTQIIKEMAGDIFQEQQRESAYYVAALAHYRLALAFSNKYVSQSYLKYKWHILTALKFAVLGGAAPDVKSKKMDAACDKLLEVLRVGGKASAEVFSEATQAIDKVGLATRDQLKRQLYTTNLLKEVQSATYAGKK